MPPAVIHVRSAEDSRDVVHRAVQALAEGKLVAFPTETVYGVAASALAEQAVARLIEAKRRPAGQPLALAVKSADEAFDYVPDLCPLGRRLARRCWPGPLTLVLPDQHPDSLVQQLPEGVRSVVAPGGSIGLRVPAHPLIADALRLLAGPVALTSANRSGQPDAVSAEEVIQQLGDDVDLVLDDGRCRFGQPSSVVQVDGNGLKVLRAGVIPEATLKRLANYILLLVCTGNTCRSPMAEILCRQRLADRLGCDVDVLEDRGVLVLSAGISAMAGVGPSHEAIQAMAQRNLDLTSHEAQPLSQRLVRHADLILTMTQVHRNTILTQWPEAADRTEILSPSGRDIPDPLGGPPEVYQHCANQIDAALAERVERISADDIGGRVPGGPPWIPAEENGA